MVKKSVTKNYIYNLLYQLLTMIIPLITTPYLSRVLGPDNIGIYSYTLSITTYFILFGSLGVAMYGQREIAFVQNDINKRSKVFCEIVILRTITLMISMIIFYLSFGMIGEYSLYYKILIFEIIANMLDISWYFQGLEEFKKTVIRNIAVKLISVISIFIFVKNSTDLPKYILIYVSSTLLGNISLWLYIPKYITKINLKELKIKRHIKPTIMLFIPQIAIQIYTVLDKTMIGTIVADKSEVGFYEQAQKITKLLLSVGTSLGTVMMPRIAATFANGNKEKIKEYMNSSFQFIMLIAFPMMFGLISVSANFVPLFFGDGYEKVIPLLCIISPIIVLIGLSNVTGTQYLLPTKQQNKFTISVVVGAIVNFILNLILIKHYKSFGASIATVIAEFTVTLTQFLLLRKQIRFLNVIKLAYKYLIAALFMFICSCFIDYIIVNNVIALCIQILISIIIYFGLLVLLKDKFVVSFIKEMRLKRHDNNR